MGSGRTPWSFKLFIQGFRNFGPAVKTNLSTDVVVRQMRIVCLVYLGLSHRREQIALEPQFARILLVQTVQRGAAGLVRRLSLAKTRKRWH